MVPNASQRARQPGKDQKRAGWLHNPCRLSFRAEETIKSGPQLGRVATYPGPTAWGVPIASQWGTNHKWPERGPGGYITPAVWGGPKPLRAWGKIRKGPQMGGGYITLAAWGVPNALDRGKHSNVTHNWDGWLHNPYCLGGPQRFTSGKTKRGGVAT